MKLFSSSDSDSGCDEEKEALNRILARSGTSRAQIPNESDSDTDTDSDSSGSDMQGWFRQIQDKFSSASGSDACPLPVMKPLCSVAPSTDSDDDDDMAEMMAVIHRKFNQYRNDAMKVQSHILVQETNTADTDVPLGQQVTDAFSRDLRSADQIPDLSLPELQLAVGGPYGVKPVMYSRFPKSAQNFVDALKKNRLCQKFMRRKLIEIEAKIEENKRLKERIKCLMDFQGTFKRTVGRVLCLRKDPRVKLISTKKHRTSKVRPSTKFPAMYFGPTENSHVSKYKLVIKRFPVSFYKRPWSETEKENLGKGLKQQYQETLLLNSMNLESDSDGSMNPDLISTMLSNDLELTAEKIRSFLPLVNWDRLASMYLTGRSGAECESRWLNCDDPLINHSPWTALEDKKLLFIVQERGIYNWIDVAITLGTMRTPFQCLARYQRSLNPYILNKDWTEEEDAMLRAAVEIFGDKNWQLVASNLEGRTGTQCSNRWRKTLNPDRKKVGRWSVDEDKHLKVAVMLFGAKNWNKIAQFAPGRTQVQCRERWLNCLDPSLKLEMWTEEEDDKLKAAIQKHGYSWSRVAASVPGRTDNQCMRRWKYLFPEELRSLREARQIKKTVLISNFVDRESERPSIGPSDFASPANLLISGCDESTSNKKRGGRKKKQTEASCDQKVSKSKANSRRPSEEHITEGGSFCPVDAAFDDLNHQHVEPRVCANTAENEEANRSRKKTLREGPQLKIQRTVSHCDDDMQIKHSRKSASQVDACDNENVPLVFWLNSLASEAKRSTNKPSRRSEMMNRKEGHCDDAKRIRAKRKRSSEESIKNGPIVSAHNMASEDKNSKLCEMISNQKGIICNPSTGGAGTMQLEHTTVDCVNDAASTSDGLARVEDIPGSTISNKKELHDAITLRACSEDDSLLGYLVRSKAKRSDNIWMENLLNILKRGSSKE